MSPATAARLQQASAAFRQGNIRQAEKLCRQIVRKAPAHAEALHLLGAISFLRKDFEQAEKLFGRVLKTVPDRMATLVSQGAALLHLNRLDESLACLDRALSADPANAKALNNRGLALQGLGRLEEALASFRAATARDPDFAEAHYNEAQIHLLAGRFDEGWMEYRWRTRLTGQSAGNAALLHRAPLPNRLEGRRLVVLRELGVGDEIYFLRFVPELRRRGAIVTYIADPRIAPMLERARIVDRVVPFHAWRPSPDLHLALADLPWMLAEGSADLTPPPYGIPALPEREGAFADILKQAGPAPHVGLTWQAGTPDSGIREAPLGPLCDIVRRFGGTPVIVQRNPAASQLAAMRAAFGGPVLDLSARNADLEDMLALMGLLDEYVCVSNTNQHLRAARSRTSRVLVSSMPEYRWMAAGEESPWFPGTRVYRQSPSGDWSTAFAALERGLMGQSGAV